jgi:methylmalonyl-CoA mutase
MGVIPKLANMVQQSPHALAHANEYFNRIINKPIVFEVSVGTNYF